MDGDLGNEDFVDGIYAHENKDHIPGGVLTHNVTKGIHI